MNNLSQIVSNLTGAYTPSAPSNSSAVALSGSAGSRRLDDSSSASTSEIYSPADYAKALSETYADMYAMEDARYEKQLRDERQNTITQNTLNREKEERDWNRQLEFNEITNNQYRDNLKYAADIENDQLVNYYSRLSESMQKAGLNPALLYQNSGVSSGNVSVSSGSGAFSSSSSAGSKASTPSYHYTDKTKIASELAGVYKQLISSSSQLLGDATKSITSLFKVFA